MKPIQNHSGFCIFNTLLAFGFLILPFAFLFGLPGRNG